MSSTIIRPSSREEWLKIRESGIGSSEVATIVGLNPWETPYQLWRRKVGIDPPKQESFAMKAGHYLEDAVSRFWADATGREIIKRSAIDWIIRDDDKPYLQVSPDRTYWLDEGRGNNNKGILECKTTQMSVDAEDIPKNWFCQVQYQLGVAGYQHGSLAWLSSGRTFDFVDINFVPEFYEWLLASVDKFWIDCIQGRQEPEAINVDDVLTKYSIHTGGKIAIADEMVFNAFLELKDVRSEIEKLEECKESLEAVLKMAFADAESMVYDGKTIATWKAPKPSAKFDAKAFQAEHPDACKPYMKPYQGARRFLLK